MNGIDAEVFGVEEPKESTQARVTQIADTAIFGYNEVYREVPIATDEGRYEIVRVIQPKDPNHLNFPA